MGVPIAHYFAVCSRCCVLCVWHVPLCCVRSASRMEWGALGCLHDTCLHAGVRRPLHSRIRRVQDWIEVEDALAELALLSPQR